MKLSFVGRITAVVLLAVFLTSCGGSSSSGGNENPVIPKSNLAKRVLVTNTFFGAAQIVDATTDTISSFIVVKTDGTRPTFGTLTKLYPVTNKTFMLDESTNSVYMVHNATEQLTAGATFGGTIAGFVATPDARYIYAAIPGAGKIQWIDLTATTLALSDIAMPGIRRMVVTGNGSHVLAFGDDTTNVRVIKVSDNRVTTVGGFDRPYSAVVSSDNTKAYVFNCGSQCGGGQPRVSILDLMTNTVTGNVNVGGATTGVIEGSTLYVVGSPGISSSSANGGTIDVINLTTFTRTGGANISDGIHEQIVVAPNSKIYIGARACTQIVSATVNKGCLSMYNTSTGAVTIGGPLGDVTGLTTVSGRNVVYTVQNGNAYIYDTATDTLQSKQLDFTGKVTDVKELK